MTTTQEKCGTIFESGSEVIFHGYYKPQRISDWKFLEEKGNWLKPFNCELTFKVENDKIISSFQNEAYPASVCELSTDIWVYQDNDTKRFEPYMMFVNSKRSIFQIFWRLHCCAKFLSFELKTSNFGYLLIF